MTVAEFLAWNPSSAQLWQLVDGEPQAMAPANRTHGAIQSELSGLIRNHLAEASSPCSVVITPGIIPRVLSRSNFRIPDLAVTCSGYETEESALADPVLVIEILSPSNHTETRANVWAYASILSVQEILVLKTTSIGAELLRRNPDGSWPNQPLSIETGDRTLASSGFSISLSAAYRTTRLAAKKWPQAPRSLAVLLTPGVGPRRAAGRAWRRRHRLPACRQARRAAQASQGRGAPSPNGFRENASVRNFADYAMSAEFRAGLAELRSLAGGHTGGHACALMCAEAVWWRCHRRIIADHLLAEASPSSTFWATDTSTLRT